MWVWDAEETGATCRTHLWSNRHVSRWARPPVFSSPTCYCASSRRHSAALSALLTAAPCLQYWDCGRGMGRKGWAGGNKDNQCFALSQLPWRGGKKCLWLCNRCLIVKIQRASFFLVLLSNPDHDWQILLTRSLEICFNWLWWPTRSKLRTSALDISLIPSVLDLKLSTKDSNTVLNINVD